MVSHTIKDKTVLITGGAKNLGALIARDVATSGARAIAIHYNSAATKESADKLVTELESAGVSKVVAIQADLTTAKAVEGLFKDTVRAIGKPDIAINTVGKVLKKPILEIDEEEYDEMFAVNTKVAFFFVKEAGKYVNDNGKILNIVTSLLGAYTPFYSTYAGSKAAVEHFTRAASQEYGSRGISVNAIGPGPMDTPFFYGQETPESVAYLKSAAALSSFNNGVGLTDAKDVVPFVHTLISDGWWMTGQTILLNGGFTTK